jgi:hypothetical protein
MTNKDLKPGDVITFRNEKEGACMVVGDSVIGATYTTVKNVDFKDTTYYGVIEILGGIKQIIRAKSNWERSRNICNIAKPGYKFKGKVIYSSDDIFIDNKKVEISDQSITVGCTTVDFATVDKIYQKMLKERTK